MSYDHDVPLGKLLLQYYGGRDALSSEYNKG